MPLYSDALITIEDYALSNCQVYDKQEHQYIYLATVFSDELKVKLRTLTCAVLDGCSLQLVIVVCTCN